MRFAHVAFAAFLTVLSGSMLWSCNKDDAQSSPASPQPEEQPLSQAISAGGAGTMQQLRAGCPMVGQGADVSASDTEGGVALTFTTGALDVADLRRRVRNMAQMYETHRGHGAMMWHQMGGERMGHGAGMRMEQVAGSGPMPATSPIVTDTEKGARIELRPPDPSQLEAVRQHVRLHQQRMHSGECWMQQGQPPVQDGQE